MTAVLTTIPALERLNLLKKDHSQIGTNARKAVKFLDQITSTSTFAHEPVTIQGPDDQFAHWSQVEAHYAQSQPQPRGQTAHESMSVAAGPAPELRADAVTPEQQFARLSMGCDELRASPISTPPLSPSTSGPLSTKTSPEIRCALVSKHDATPVPPILQPLINFAVWYMYERKSAAAVEDWTFLTNSADTAQIIKDFGINTKTIHQLRAAVQASLMENNVLSVDQLKKRYDGRPVTPGQGFESRTLFRYDEGSSEEEEELLFQPRMQNSPRPASSSRGANFVRGRGAVHSPSSSLHAIAPQTPQTPQIPVEEIDPDSFDRGTFARGSTPLANVGVHVGMTLGNGNNNNTFGRGGYARGGFGSGGSRSGGYGGHSHRGGLHNTFRGGRGRGRLFVP